jgi:hypothetical protein
VVYSYKSKLLKRPIVDSLDGSPNTQIERLFVVDIPLSAKPEALP